MFCVCGTVDDGEIIHELDFVFAQVTSQNKAFGVKSGELDQSMVGAQDSMRKHVASTDEDVFDAEADVVNYVMQVIFKFTLSSHTRLSLPLSHL